MPKRSRGTVTFLTGTCKYEPIITASYILFSYNDLVMYDSKLTSVTDAYLKIAEELEVDPKTSSVHLRGAIVLSISF